MQTEHQADPSPWVLLSPLANRHHVHNLKLGGLQDDVEGCSMIKGIKKAQNGANVFIWKTPQDISKTDFL